MNGILQTEAYVLGGRIYPPSAILTKKEFKDPDRLLMMEKNIRNKGNGVYFGRDFRRNCNDPQMKSITDMNLSHLVLSDDVEYAKQQRNYKIAMSDEKGRLGYSTKLRNPDGSGLLQYSDGYVAVSNVPSAVHAKAISRIVGKGKGTTVVSPMTKVVNPIAPANFKGSMSIEHQQQWLVENAGYTIEDVLKATTKDKCRDLYQRHKDGTPDKKMTVVKSRVDTNNIISSGRRKSHSNMGFGIRR